MTSNPAYRFLDCLVRPATRELLRGGEHVMLPSKVFDCIVYLIENRHRAVGRDELGAAVWERIDVTDAQLSQAVLRARRALGDAGSDQRCIKTMPKFGYGWVAEVEVLEDAHAPATSQPTTTHAPLIQGARDDSPHIETSEARTLAQAALPSGSTSRRHRPLAWVAVWIVAAVMAMGAVLWFRGRDADVVVAEQGGVLILPIVTEGSGAASWVRLGAIDVIADRIRMAGMPVPPSDTTLALIGADKAGVDSATLRERAGAEWIVRGSAMLDESGWQIALTAEDASSHSYQQRADADNVIDALNAATDGLLAQLGRAPPAARSDDTAADETLRQIKVAMLENDLGKARALADESVALAADPFERRFQLAQIDFREGRLDAAAAEARAALTEMDADARPELAGRIQILLGSIDLMMDRPADAASRFEDAVKRLDPVKHALEHARAMAGRGAAHFSMGEHGRGLDDIGRARMALQQSGDPLAQARIDMMAGSAELLRRRPAQARTLLSAAAASLQNFGAWNERMHALSELVLANLDLLDIDAAEAASDASMTLMSKVPNTLHRAEALLNRANLRIQQGRLSDARQLVEGYEALGLAGHARMTGLKHALLAHIAMWEGNDAQVIAQVGLALQSLPENEREIAARSVLARAEARWRVVGPTDDGGLDELPVMLTTTPEPVPIAVALIERKRLRGQDPGTAFAALLAQSENQGAPFDQLIIAEAWAKDLIRQGRPDEAMPLLGRLAPLAGRNFRYALLELRLSHAEHNVVAWQRALQHAERLAGERPIPPELRLSPAEQ